MSFANVGMAAPPSSAARRSHPAVTAHAANITAPSHRHLHAGTPCIIADAARP
jgi:hypothetical protein